jgi:hypothetical protein
MPIPITRGHLIALAVAAALLPEAAAAYVGPGAGLTALGTVFALLGALALAVVGFVWYPVKRMLRRDTATPSGREAEAPHK